jgi:hypothetical protein
VSVSTSHPATPAPRSGSPLKLEVGRTYVTRDGTETVTICQMARCVSWAVGDNGRNYLSDGRVDAYRERQADLVAEANTTGGSAHEKPPVSAEWMDTSVDKPKSIPHADLIRAVLDGKVVQIQFEDGVWREYDPTRLIGWLVNPGARQPKFRLKPEPVVRYIPIFDTISGISVIVGNTELPGNTAGQQCNTKAYAIEALHPNDAQLMRGGKHGKVLRLELDPDTLDVIDARTEAP